MNGFQTLTFPFLFIPDTSMYKYIHTYISKPDFSFSFHTSRHENMELVQAEAIRRDACLYSDKNEGLIVVPEAAADDMRAYIQKNLTI
jgi:hypothetical protein